MTSITIVKGEVRANNATIYATRSTIIGTGNCIFGDGNAIYGEGNILAGHGNRLHGNGQIEITGKDNELFGTVSIPSVGLSVFPFAFAGSNIGCMLTDLQIKRGQLFCTKKPHRVESDSDGEEAENKDKKRIIGCLYCAGADDKKEEPVIVPLESIVVGPYGAPKRVQHTGNFAPNDSV